jgi:hypothetical protein
MRCIEGEKMMKEIKECKSCEHFMGIGEYKKSDGTSFHIYDSLCCRYPEPIKKHLYGSCGEYKKVGKLNEG